MTIYKIAKTMDDGEVGFLYTRRRRARHTKLDIAVNKTTSRRPAVLSAGEYYAHVLVVRGVDGIDNVV